MRVEFSRDGAAISDFEAEGFVRHELSRGHSIRASTANVITAARVLIAEGVFSYDEVEFVFNKSVMKPNKDGRLTQWPEGFCDHEEKWLGRLILRSLPDE